MKNKPNYQNYERIGKEPGTGKKFEKKPTIAYYQVKASEHPKVRQLKPGSEIVGTFLHTFIDQPDPDQKPQYKYLIGTKEGNVSLNGYTVLNERMALVPKGTDIRIVYMGPGTASKKGRKPPELFDVFRQKASDLQDTAPELEESSDDSEDENDPF